MCRLEQTYWQQHHVFQDCTVVWPVNIRLSNSSHETIKHSNNVAILLDLTQKIDSNELDSSSMVFVELGTANSSNTASSIGIFQHLTVNLLYQNKALTMSMYLLWLVLGIQQCSSFLARWLGTAHIFYVVLILAVIDMAYQLVESNCKPETHPYTRL